MEMVKLDKETYIKTISEGTREKLYYATTCANSLYSLFFDLHNELKKQNAHLYKNLVHNYKRVEKLTEQLTTALLHLGYTKGTDDEVNEQILAMSDILEVFIKLIIDRVASSVTEDFRLVIDLYNKLMEMPSHNLIEVSEPDWEELFDNFNIEKETTDEDNRD